MAEMLAFLVRLLVVRCLEFAVVQALIRARGSSGAICVLLAEPKTLSKRRRVESVAFDLQRTRSKCSGALSVCRGADSVCSGTGECRMSVVLSGALCSTRAASSDLTGAKDSAGAFAVAR